MTEQGPEEEATTDLVAAVRRLRIWTISLTAAVALLAIATVVGGIVLSRESDTVADPNAMYMGAPPSVTDEQLASTREDIESAYGDKLDTVEVRRVTMDYGDPMMPLAAGGEEQLIYANYRLKGSPVAVADIVGGMFGPDAASMGMLPTEGSLTSHMTLEEFGRLLVAYAAKTSTPLGNVRRYDDSTMAMMTGSAPKSVVSVGDKKYKTSDLWAASEGLALEGDQVGVEEMGSRKALIFYKDPQSGEFTFLGTEPAVGGW